MNWGWKIFIVIVSFLALILFMVFKAVNEDFYLVADNYYEKEIKYQDEIDKIRNARSLSKQISISYILQEESIHFKYPESQVQSISGKVQFFRPSDSRMDKVYDIKPANDGIQRISVKSLEKGLWQIKVNWSYGSEDYQEEKNIMIQ